MMYIIMSLLTLLILTRVLLSKFKNFQEWLSSDFVSTDSGKSLDKSQYIDYFRLAAGIYLGIPKNRIYLEFAEAKGDLWGWNGSTFG